MATYRQLCSWTIQDVSDWLREEGFSKHTKAFQDKYINGEKLLNITEATMKQQMNLIPPNDRKKILEAIERLKASLIADQGDDDVSPMEEQWSDDDEDNQPQSQPSIHQPAAMTCRADSGSGEEYEVPPDKDSSDDDSADGYTEPDEELQARISAARGANATRPPLARPPPQPVAKPVPVPKPAVIATKSTAKPALPQKPADVRATAVSPSEDPAPPMPVRPPKSNVVRAAVNPTITKADRESPPPTVAKDTRPPINSKRPSPGNSHVSGSKGPAARGNNYADTAPPAPAPGGRRQPPAPAEATPEDSGEDAEMYLVPDDPNTGVPIQLPESTSVPKGSKPNANVPSTTSKLKPTEDKPLPTKPAAASPRAAPSTAVRALPRLPPPASATEDKLPASADITEDQLPQRLTTPGDSARSAKSTAKGLMKKFSLKTQSSSAGGDSAAAATASSTAKNGRSPASTSSSQPQHDEVDEAQYEEEAPDEQPEPDPGKSARTSSTDKLRHKLSSVFGQAMSSMKVKGLPKKSSVDEGNPSMPDASEQSTSGGSLNHEAPGGSSRPPGQRPPAQLPPADGWHQQSAASQSSGSRLAMPLPQRPGSKQPDSDSGASESGSDSGVFSSRRALPALPVSSIKEEKAPPLPRPKEAKPKGTTAESTLEQQPWFHPDMTRKDAEAGLQRLNKEGSFVIRNSSKGTASPEPYSLSVQCTRVFHLLVRRKPDGRFALGTEKPDEATFASIIEMVDHHKKFAITLSSADGQDTRSTVLTMHL